MINKSSVFRRHRASVKVYVPKVSRDNHYLIAEMPLTDKLLELVVGKIDTTEERPYQKFYQKLGRLALNAVEECDIAHANFVANNRLVRVRHNEEQQVLHTEKQSFFFYSPLHNSTFKGYFDGAVRSNKIKFLFLATGDNLREDAAEFHEKVISAVELISARIGLDKEDLKVRDHQHLTYDIFARQKGNKESVTHTFREISARYLHQGYPVPETASAITYAVVSMPMTRRLLKDTAIDYDAEKPYELLYEKISTAFTNSVKTHQLKHATMLANGMSPIVRLDKEKKTIINGDIISLGYNPEEEGTDVTSQWEGDKLVDTIQFIYCATDSDETHNTYGKFVNNVTQAVNTMAEDLNWNKERDYMLMRLNQQLLRRI
ncbi:DUF3083 family protein [Colwellia echini]|uniref:DUF3083 family protein n=1 Tax=Colwellia echini TaxID=1982103 RepID=A0ABY3MSU2_9GAMM|nr:DUF3083 family protein [Colwellia echini]TYK64266.1 DUF3083 family protein [Colwellia echini]